MRFHSTTGEEGVAHPGSLLSRVVEVRGEKRSKSLGSTLPLRLLVEIILLV